MEDFKTGDRVKIKNRTDWPSPPGHRLANSEGTVVKWIDWDELVEQFREYVPVQLEKVEGEGEVYTGNTFFFRMEDLEKIS